MKYKWLNRQNNKKLIIFFNGWGMDDRVVTHLKPEDYDVLMFYDYNTLETDFDFETANHYEEVNLAAWSMGVMIGSKFASKIKHLHTSTAINGTLKPINPDFGIHPKIYDLTIKGFDEKNRNRFIENMFDADNGVTPLSNPLFKERELSGQKTELIAIKSYSADENFTYNKVLLSNNDKIIPTKSQCRFWNIEPNLKSGHCPFFQFEKWSELL